MSGHIRPAIPSSPITDEFVAESDEEDRILVRNADDSGDEQIIEDTDSEHDNVVEDAIHDFDDNRLVEDHDVSSGEEVIGDSFQDDDVDKELVNESKYHSDDS